MTPTSTAARIARRFQAEVTLRDVPYETSIATCSPGCTLTSNEVVELLRRRGIEAAAVVFVGKMAENKIAFEARLPDQIPREIS